MEDSNNKRWISRDANKSQQEWVRFFLGLATDAMNKTLSPDWKSNRGEKLATDEIHGAVLSNLGFMLDVLHDMGYDIEDDGVHYIFRKNYSSL